MHETPSIKTAFTYHTFEFKLDIVIMLSRFVQINATHVDNEQHRRPGCYSISHYHELFELPDDEDRRDAAIQHAMNMCALPATMRGDIHAAILEHWLQAQSETTSEMSTL